MSELVAERAQGGGRVAEACGDIGTRAVIEEVGAEGLVLALSCGFRGSEELGRLRTR